MCKTIMMIIHGAVCACLCIQADARLCTVAWIVRVLLIGRAGASPPSRTTGPRCLYNIICIYVCVYTVNF